MSKTDDFRGQRKKLFCDARVQGGLLLRTFFYWCFCLLTITLMLLCWRILTGPARMFYMHFDDMWFHFGPALIASFLLLPLVLVDVLRHSNRFVGPMVRMRRLMRAVAEGKPVSPVFFRDGDFWQEFAADFNALARRVQELEMRGGKKDSGLMPVVPTPAPEQDAELVASGEEV